MVHYLKNQIYVRSVLGEGFILIPSQTIVAGNDLNLQVNHG